ncbi:MAG: helix-turn-helix domain-containing protein [Methylacidiphilales bacterium]|nr:helix-turn-helix domain-containing protein [Candidatus Methylacidiphilales bacterium]
MTKAKITKKRRFRNITGPAVRRLRNARGWTQSELAAKLQIIGLDLDRADIAKIESQLRSLFDFELFLLADVLGVEPSALNPGLKKVRGDLSLLRRGYK